MDGRVYKKLGSAKCGSSMLSGTPTRGNTRLAWEHLMSLEPPREIGRNRHMHSYALQVCLMPRQAHKHCHDSSYSKAAWEEA